MANLPKGRSIALCAALAFLAPADTAPARQPASLEYRVKSAYLLNFARYVEWPSDAFASASDPLSVCVTGDDPFGHILDQTFRGHVVGGRAVVARRIPSTDQGRDCHILFVPADAEDDGIGTLSEKPVLTVGESRSFLSHGGIVRFLIVEDTVRFEVDIAAAQRAKLKISSRMLEFAWAVRPATEG